MTVDILFGMLTLFLVIVVIFMFDMSFNVRRLLTRADKILEILEKKT